MAGKSYFSIGLRVRHADETNISPARFQTSNAPLDQWSANTVINDAERPCIFKLLLGVVDGAIRA